MAMGVLTRDWGTWGPPVFITLFTPWQDKLIKLSLISDYFQPSLQIFATILGPLCCMIGYGVMGKWPGAKQKKAAVISTCWLILAYLVCIGLFQLDAVWMPDIGGTIAIRTFWMVIYLSVYISMAIALIAGFLTVRARRN